MIYLKPFISITPTKKFVNSSPHPIYPLEFKDMDRLLAEERTKNRRLVEELNKIKSDSHSYRSQTEGVSHFSIFTFIYRINIYKQFLKIMYFQ